MTNEPMRQAVGYSQIAATISKNEFPNFGACGITLPTLMFFPFMVQRHEWRIMSAYCR
jgi:hypothetical protein